MGYERLTTVSFRSRIGEALQPFQGENPYAEVKVSGLEGIDGVLRVSLRSHLIDAPIPLDDFYVLVMQLKAWRNSNATTFKPAAQIIGGVSGHCTVFANIVIIRNVSRRCCDSSSKSH